MASPIVAMGRWLTMVSTRRLVVAEIHGNQLALQPKENGAGTEGARICLAQGKEPRRGDAALG
jgi:hypothetical protein